MSWNRENGEGLNSVTVLWTKNSGLKLKSKKYTISWIPILLSIIPDNVIIRNKDDLPSSGSKKKDKTEEKAKVVASVWGDRTHSIPCRASYFAYEDFEE